MSAKRQVDAAEVSPMLDFRAQDDAWYSVRLRLEGEKLFVMFCDFPQESDEVYSVEAFTNIESVEEFQKRFRLTSSQLQDRNCDVVVKGMMVCASNRFAVDDLRFFDAIVESHVSASNLEEFSNHSAKGRYSSERMVDNLEQDFDMGGQSLRKHQHFEKKRTYFCRIDNLEKDLSAFTLQHFVQEHLRIPCLAFICPSISHEFCTRGFILVEEKYQNDKLMDFLLNKEYIIVSLKGRPWIIDDACFGVAEGVMPTFLVKPSNTREEQTVQIRLVHKGTAEYEKIEKLRLLHSEFLEHIHFRLLPRLLADEKKLMKLMAEE